MKSEYWKQENIVSETHWYIYLRRMRAKRRDELDRKLSKPSVVNNKVSHSFVGGVWVLQPKRNFPLDLHLSINI